MVHPPPAAPPEIERRDLRFCFGEGDPGAWHPEGRHVSHFFNALSIFFPEGERFFIDSVRRYRPEIREPRLQSEVQGFLAQEAIHRREHQRYNEALSAAGLPADELETSLTGFLARLRRRLSGQRQLAVTIALEHYTAILADVLLADERMLAGADPKLSAVWRWHAIEETEHKAVAYDVYREVAGEGPRAAAMRWGTMLGTTLIFWTLVFRYHWRLVRADGCARDLRGWGRLFRFLWLKPGGLRKIVLPWIDYFRPGFHPWQHDNRHHVERWKVAYAALGQAPA